MSAPVAPDAPHTFRGRSPQVLSFGTSGLRGLVNDITDLEAYINTRGFLDYLLGEGLCHGHSEVALGGDLRPSSSRILKAVACAVTDAGMQARYQGRLPTPALTAWAISKGVPSIMVTGSHIPFDRNGIKFNRPDGEVLKRDEAPILQAVARVRAQEYQCPAHDSAFADDGSLRDQRDLLGEAKTEALAHYRRRYLDAFPAQALAGLKLGFFAHSAVGHELVPEILASLGAEVHSFGRSQTFVAIDTEALAADTLALLQQQADALATSTGPLDAVVSTDGDSDRPLLLAVAADGRLHFISGDLLGLAVAEYLNADAIAVPVSASDAIEHHFKQRPVEIQRTRIGSPWVIAAMQSQTGERCVGWEANGGFLVGSDLRTPDGVLSALPTRDAVLPLAAALHISLRNKQPLLECFARFPARYSRAGLLDAVEPALSRALLEQLGPPAADIRHLRFDGDTLTADDVAGRPRALCSAEQAEAQRRAQLLGSVFAAALGVGGGLSRVDALDGLRLYFGNGEIVHLRPSGNAPQLRVYAVADSEQRAQDLVTRALAEPDGLVHQLLADVG